MAKVGVVSSLVIADSHLVAFVLGSK